MFKNIGFDKYNKIRKILLAGAEEAREEVYRDSKGIATIGIGINIQSFDIWIKLILFYKFDLVKNIDDIPLKRFDGKETLKLVIKDTSSAKFKEYETLINKIAKDIQEKVKTDIETSSLNTILATHIKNYTKKTKELQNIKKDSKNNNAGQNNNKPHNSKQSKTNTESQQITERLTHDDVKIDHTDSNNPKYPTFTLTKEQAEELFDIMAINYEAITLSSLNRLNINIFNKIREAKKEDKEYYREFVPFMSATYQAPNVIKDNSLLSNTFQYKSRFLIWAIIRYSLESDARRQILQSAIFNFNNTKHKEFGNNNTISLDNENDEDKFETFKDIFKVLNLRDKIGNKKQSYLEWLEGKDSKIKLSIGNEKVHAALVIKDEYNIRNAKKYQNSPNYNIYRSGYINPNELKPLVDILNPYVEFLDSLIPQAKFERQQGFQTIKLKDANNKERNSKVRFKLKNIFFINRYNQIKAQESINTINYSNNAKQENILIILDELNTPLRFKQPNNTFLYILTTHSNTIDCSLLNNPLKDCIKANDKCELYLYDKQDDDIPKVISLSTNELILQEHNNRLIARQGDYSFEYISNNLYINKDEARLLALNNYRSYIQAIHSNDINNPNSSYILQTILEKDIPYSTLGIQLQSPKPLDTFSNNGNFELRIHNINLKYIESQSKGHITKDAPLYCYVAESKQNHTAKLDDNTISIYINIDNIESHIKRDTNDNLMPILPKYIYLSFIPFFSNYESNNTSSQKISLLAEDLERGYKDIGFKIPLNPIQDSRFFKELGMREDNKHKESGIKARDKL
ncbi:hypothetical protein CQA53_10265, partial [Helicobacter didelphidarum]